MKIVLLLILTYSLYIIPSIASPQNKIRGNPFIQNYNNRNYNTRANQIWSIVQGQRGVMYFGNNEGILEFDGSEWNIIKIPNKSTVRSLATDKNSGIIYVGAVGEIGYLKPDSIGTLKYVSLLNKIPDKYKNFEDVWQIVILNNQVIFRTSSFIFLLEKNNVKTFVAEDRFHTAFNVNNQFYVREWGKGLLKLSGGELHLIDQSEQFANERIYFMQPYENDKILLITRNQGIIIYNPRNSLNKFIKSPKFKKATDFLINNQIYCGIKLKNGNYAAGTLQGGILIFDSDGNFIYHLNKNSGLQDNDILSIYSDNQNNIWAGLNNGISYVILNSPFTVFNENNGLKGNSYSIIKYKNEVYVGTSLGLFVKNKQNNFSMINNTKGQNWCLAKIDNTLFLGHVYGIFIIKNKNAYNIMPNVEIAWSLIKIPGKPYILTGTNRGLILLEKVNSTWQFKQKIIGFNESARHMEIDSNNDVWISHANKGVFKLKLSEDCNQIQDFKFFDKKNGLPSNTNNYVFKIKSKNNTSRIVFGTENGIYKFNPESNLFTPDEKFDILKNHNSYIDKLAEGKNGNIYFQQGNLKGILILQKDGSYKLKTTPFSKFKDLNIENFFVLDSANIMLCTREGMIQYNPGIKPAYDKPYHVIIRKVSANDSLIFNGIKNVSKTYKLPYKYHNIQFSFSALFYEGHDKTKYSYFLDGFTKDWSEWSSKTDKEYTNLREGKYVFNVKAKNVFDKESTVAQFKFEIITPWYKTLVSYIFYLIIILILIWIVFRIYTRKLKKEKEVLERIIEARTKDLHETNTQLEEKQADLEVKQEEITAQKEHLAQINKELEKHKGHLEQLVNERTIDLEKAKKKAQESDRLKSAFLANMSHEIRTPMNAIVGFTDLLDNQELEDKERNDIKHHITYNCYTLLNLIDDIIDISKIEAGQLVINKKNCNINIIFKELLETFKEHKQNIGKNDIKISISKENENKSLIVFTDPIRLQQILSNLIDNALKYTEKGSVEFGYKLENDKIRFFVKDTGIGLSKDQQNIIFSRFTKIETNKKKVYRGAGLGLAISKNLTNLLGGDIWVISEPEKGSTFLFTIPYIKKEDKEQTHKEPTTDISKFEWPGKTILIAEDEESNFLYFKMLLSKSKANILHANTGNKVIELFRAQKTDLILMDIKMPEMDGLEATKIIRKENKEIPIIAVTAFAMENDEKESLEAGCNMYIQKPIKKISLLNLINLFLS